MNDRKDNLNKYQRQMMILLLEQKSAISDEYEKRQIEISIRALEEGFSLEYLYQNLSEERSVEDCTLVIEILQMFRVLKQSIKHIQKTSPEGFNSEDLQNIKLFSTFEGFDINDGDETGEGWMASYCRYLFDQNKFKELENDLDEKDTCNSHIPKLDHYKRMLQEFEASSKNKGILNVQDIRKILVPRKRVTSRQW